VSFYRDSFIYRKDDDPVGRICGVLSETAPDTLVSLRLVSFVEPATPDAEPWCGARRRSWQAAPAYIRIQQWAVANGEFHHGLRHAIASSANTLPAITDAAATAVAGAAIASLAATSTDRY
jgi:hypothetical protein